MRRDVTEATAEDEGEINLTPMLDVVFIMLIFFIVTASFIKEPGSEVIRPEAVTARRQANASILIAVTRNDEIWIDRHKVPAAGVRAVIEQLMAENPEGAVVIQADKEAHADAVLAVMESARAAGVSQIAIAAEAD